MKLRIVLNELLEESLDKNKLALKNKNNKNNLVLRIK